MKALHSAMHIVLVIVNVERVNSVLVPGAGLMPRPASWPQVVHIKLTRDQK